MGLRVAQAHFLFAADCRIFYNKQVQEYVNDAIVLAKEPSGDLDARVTLFTRQFGKLKTKAKSARKIISKLSGHLEPGFLTRVRLIEKNGLQVVDALKGGVCALHPRDLHFLEKVLAEGEPEQRIWQMILTEKIDWSETLKILGWDPSFALCGSCSAPKPAFFGYRDQEFFCRNCVAAFKGGAKEANSALIEVGTDNASS